MALDIDSILDRITSHALASGYFEAVNGHEPKNAPGSGLTAAVWVDAVQPAVSSSGLASSSALLVFYVRLYTSMHQEPQDAIDPNLVKALSALFSAYAGDFELGGDARMVDLRGAEGSLLSARAGYLNQDQRLLRVITITLPVIVNDAWDEVA
ncbi:hypothetical protein TR51_06645 [Kitasatospora griseola]|uniref:Uncharacterized protein n=1 Tax=Kitasatospora griseola TaxID=2064 RepID=A0A0D0Q3C1_KITGR|nr:hypothetical protein [Kitasatospora griseola]KIQ67057.1 hypothetical protein TR51_06645 [Kitasatospora griseola]